MATSIMDLVCLHGVEGLAPEIVEVIWLGRQLTTWTSMAYSVGMPLSPKRQAKLRRRADRALLDPKALSFRPETYLVALDESGQKGVRFPMEKSRSYMVGGIVIPNSRISQLRQVWQDHQEMVEGQEVKVKDYVRKFGAITSLDPHVNAGAVLSVVLSWAGVLPIFVHTPKQKTGPFLKITTHKGGEALDNRWFFYQLGLQIAAFLGRYHQARVICDCLSSRAEQDTIQEVWADLHGVFPRLGPLEFVDSEISPEIQIAGVLMGILCRYGETRVGLPKGVSDSISEAKRRGLLNAHIL